MPECKWGENMKLEKLDQTRYAIATAFLLGGISVGLWLVHIPTIAQRLDLNTSILGLVFLTSAVGAAAGQLLMGIIISHIGSRKALLLSLPALLIGAVLPIIAWNVVVLFVAAFVFGAASGFYNIAVNIQASQFQATRAQPTMSFFHGFFSLGGIGAAALGSIVISIGWADGSGAIVVSLIMLGVGAYISKYYLPHIASHNSVAAKSKFSWPHKSLLALAAMAFANQMIEGAIGDWSALFLTDIKHTGINVATMGYAALSFAMAFMRFAGAAIINKTNEKTVVTVGGGFAVLGIIVALAAPWPLVSASGFFIIGIGVANILPILLGVAGQSTDMEAGTAVAITATTGQMGLILGPTIIGFIADIYNLSYGIGFLGVMGGFIAISGMLRKWNVLPKHK